MQNALLNEKGLPLFSKITPDMVEPAVDQILAENRSAIDDLLKNQKDYSWENLVFPLEELDDRLNRAWSPVSHMNSVVNTDNLRVAYNACLPKLIAYATEMGHNQDLFQAFKQISESNKYADLDVAQKKIIDNALRDFRLAGIALPEKEKARFKELMERQSKLTTQFEENILDATQAWEKHVTDVDALAGLPESALSLLVHYANQKELPGWLIKLEYPSYLPVMTYAVDRDLRQEVYTAFVTRASDQGPNAGQWDNTKLMQELLANRHEIALLLSFDNYAQRSLATKMAEDPDQVMQFLNDLASRSRSVALDEYQQLQTFAKEQDNIDSIEAWDIP